MGDNILVKDFRTYPPTSIPAVDGKVLMWNTNNNKLELIKLSNISGGAENIPQWSSAPASPYEDGYPINYVVQYDNKIWASLSNDNLDNSPVAGSSFWDEVSKASVSNFSRWKAGIYSDSATLVVKDNGIYVLDKDVSLPFNSVDFDAELTAGTWVNPSGNEFNSIILNTNPPPIITGEGTLYWNGSEHTINVITGLGATIQLGQETLVLVYNDTGSVVGNFKVLHPIGAELVNDTNVIKVEFADASDHNKCQGTLLVATQEIAIGAIGFAVRFGKARIGNTSAWGADKQLWLGTDGTGSMTIVKPSFPNFALSTGGTMNDSVADGEIFVSINTTIEDTFNDAWDGGIRESFKFIPTSNGTTVIGTLTNANPALDLILFFSDVGMYTFDTTTTPKTIELVLGTDTAPATNYVYIPKSTKVLTVSTSGFPITEHCKVAILEVESAATTQTQSGTLRNQNINDHIKKEDNNGHILHIAERIRRLNADHDSGTEAILDATAGNGYISITGGKVWQMHIQDFPALNMQTGSLLRVVNNFTTPYVKISNLTAITAYSSGLAWNNEYGKIVVWGVINSGGQPCFMMANLPSNGYNSEANAVADASKYANYSIPKKFKGVGFLIAEFTIRIGGGSITYNSLTGYKDLRGFIPNNIAGGGGGSGITSLLSMSDVFISTYAGKKGQSAVVNDLETGIITEAKNWIYNTARTFYSTISAALLTANRVHTLPDKDMTFAGLDDITIGAENLPAYRYNFNPSTAGGDPGAAKFALNNAVLDDATELYISKTHYRASGGGATAITNFINDIAVGAYLTSEGISYLGGGNDSYFEVKVLSNADNDTYNTFGIQRTVGFGISGTPSATDQFWFGFHQAAVGAISVVTDEVPLPALKFDKNYWATLANKIVMSADVTLSLDTGVANVVGNSNFFDLQADGVSQILIGSGIKSVIPSDLNTKVLDAGTYEVYSSYSPDGVVINMPGVLSAGNVIVTPTVSTLPVTFITADSGTFNGEVTDLGGENATAHGFVYGLSPTPTLSDTVINLGTLSAVGSFNSIVTGLVEGTTYYIRAFATNSIGTEYGLQVDFSPSSAVVDFITTWETSVVDTEIFLPTSAISGKDIDVTIDWGDGSGVQVWQSNSTILFPSHTYAIAGVYDITMHPNVLGGLPGFNFISKSTSKLFIIDIKQWGSNKLYSLSLYNCANLEITALDFPDISDVANLSSCFQGTNMNPDLTNWDFGGAVSLAYFAQGNVNFNPNGWDLSNIANVISLLQALYGCTSFDKDISGGDYSGITNATNLFGGTSKLSTVNYDLMLISMDGQTLNSGVTWGFNTSKYTLGGAAEAARTSLISKGLIIVDGGGI